MRTTRNYNAIIHMAMLLAVCFVAYSCSSDDDENEPEYPVVTDSKYYVAPDWDESIVYVPGLIFHDEFIPGVRVVEKLVDYPAYVTYRSTMGERGMDICFVKDVDDKLGPDPRTIFYDGERPMATVLDWDNIDEIRRYRMTVDYDTFLKYNLKNPCKVYVTALVTNAGTFNLRNLDTYYPGIMPWSDEYKIQHNPEGTVFPKSEWIKYPIERKAYLIDLKMRK